MWDSVFARLQIYNLSVQGQILLGVEKCTFIAGYEQRSRNEITQMTKNMVRITKTGTFLHTSRGR
jgi:hypothetical protein